MNTCRKCGVEHGTGILDTVTQVNIAIDICYDCLWENKMVYTPDDPVYIAADHATTEMREAQDRRVRYMMICSASVPFVEGEDPPCTPTWVDPEGRILGRS